MLTSITLQNFKSFGEEQTIPLQPISVLVGPNNSGKSNLVSLARLIRSVVKSPPGAQSSFAEEGGLEFVFHRPAPVDAIMRIAWTVEATGSYSTELVRGGTPPQASSKRERIDASTVAEPWTLVGNRPPFTGLWHLFNSPNIPTPDQLRPVCAPMAESRELQLSAPSLRRDADVVPEPRLGADGSGMAAVLGFWRGAKLDRAEALDTFVKACLPEVARVLVKPGPTSGQQRLWVQQTDGEQFDAVHVSDGVLSFIALAMHAIDAEPGSLILIEEPEQSIHPRRIHDLVELFRKIVHERKCQIVVVTHSPVLLHELKDDPEAILLFRRSATGTRVNPLTDFPDLIEAMTTRKADPGNLLVDGFLTDPT